MGKKTSNKIHVSHVPLLSWPNGAAFAIPPTLSSKKVVGHQTELSETAYILSFSRILLSLKFIKYLKFPDSILKLKIGDVSLVSLVSQTANPTLSQIRTARSWSSQLNFGFCLTCRQTPLMGHLKLLRSLKAKYKVFQQIYAKLCKCEVYTRICKQT